MCVPVHAWQRARVCVCVCGEQAVSRPLPGSAHDSKQHIRQWCVCECGSAGDLLVRPARMASMYNIFTLFLPQYVRTFISRLRRSLRSCSTVPLRFFSSILADTMRSSNRKS